jgi:hypothetical protein
MAGLVLGFKKNINLQRHALLPFLKGWHGVAPSEKQSSLCSQINVKRIKKIRLLQ